MPNILLYINIKDKAELLEFLNSEQDIAFIVSNGNKKWIAKNIIDDFQQRKTIIWHIPSGPLPLFSKDNKKEKIENPFNGWEEQCSAADSTIPYFGAAWTGIMLFNLDTDKEDMIRMSSIEWIGNHYKIIGIAATDSTYKFWNKLRREIQRRSTKIRAMEDDRYPKDIYAMKGALSEITHGKPRAANVIY